MELKRNEQGAKAAKARGVRLGNPGNATPEGRLKGTQEASRIRLEQARHRASDLAPVIADIRNQGASSLRQIAAELNRRGIPTARGGKWSAVQVKRIFDTFSPE